MKDGADVQLLHIDPVRMATEPPAVGISVMLLKPPFTMLMRRDWSGMENIPPTGYGCIIAANHVSYIDPIVLAHYIYDAGRVPCYMAKDSLFELPVAGWIMNNARQIPVHRETGDARAALQDAIEAIKGGAALVIYPEGTVTRDPDFWPMHPKNGVARLALATGAPVIPVGQFGAQQIYDHYDRKLSLFPPKTVRVRAGEPVDISEFEGREWNRELLDACAVKIMQDVKKAVGEVRGETPPAELAPRPEPARTRPATEAETAAAEAAGRAAANRPPRPPSGL